jgi:hypothetical protein
MKIRSGFVSNSSSSSFVVIAPKSVVDDTLHKMSTNEKAAVNWIKTEDKLFCGKMVSIFQGVTGNYSSWEDFGYPEDFDEEDENEIVCASKIFDDFTERLKKSTNDVIEISTDM